MIELRTADASGARFLPATEGLRGAVKVPGDKSISHRAVLLGAVNSGTVEVKGFLRSEDTLATVRAVRSLGVKVDEQQDRLVVHGSGWEGLAEPEGVIDVANSGTLIRLLPGIVAPRDFLCVLTGDASISRRPMGRVLAPLAEMGVKVDGRGSASLPPVVVRGGRVRAVDHCLTVASAQVKSCLLLAGLRADGPTTVTEPIASRDHTERMLAGAGVRVEREAGLAGGPRVRVWPVDSLCLSGVEVPGDFSSAAFLIVGAVITPGSDVTVEEVGLNPTRIGLLRALLRMGAELEIESSPLDNGEAVGRVTARYSELSATDIDAEEVPGLIDELPAFMLAAAKAQGRSVIRGAQELRVKESDRLSAMARLLTELGVRVTEHPDGVEIEGSPAGWLGGSVRASSDHRLAMVAAIAGCASMEGVSVDDTRCTAVSFPGFMDTLGRLGGRYELSTEQSGQVT